MIPPPPSLDLLGLPGILVTGVRDEPDNVMVIEVETYEPTIRQCCLLQDVRKMGTKRPRYRDYPIRGRTVFLEVRQQRFQCKGCGGIIYETMLECDDNFRMTKRFREHLENEAIQRSFSDAARTNGVHETLIRRIFADKAALELANYTVRLPRVLGMDEKYIQKIPRFVIGDVERRYMLDMRQSRLKFDLEAYFDQMVGRDGVEVICQDMYKGYRTLTKSMFPRAVTVVDKFHVVSLGNAGVESVRKAIQATLDNKSRIELKGLNKVLLARWEGAKPGTLYYLRKMFSEHPVLDEAYFHKERLYDIYEHTSRAAAERALTMWATELPGYLRSHFKAALTAIGNWRPFMLRYFEHPYTNAYVESLNGLVDEMNRIGRGYNFDVLRAKALLKYGDVKQLIDIFAYDLMSCSEEEREDILSCRVGHGVPISTLMDDLREGAL